MIPSNSESTATITDLGARNDTASIISTALLVDNPAMTLTLPEYQEIETHEDGEDYGEGEYPGERGFERPVSRLGFNSDEVCNGLWLSAGFD
jgi:hypothetical protein